MRSSRESISVALTALLKSSYQFKLVLRKPRIWSDVPPAQQPSLMVFKAAPAEDWSQSQAYGLTRYLLNYSVIIYARAEASPDSVGEILLNTILDNIDTAMQPKPPYERQTLGGLVEHAWIDGPVQIDTGGLDEQCALLMNVKVLVPM